MKKIARYILFVPGFMFAYSFILTACLLKLFFGENKSNQFLRKLITKLVMFGMVHLVPKAKYSAWRSAILMGNPFIQHFPFFDNRQIEFSFSLALHFNSLLLKENISTSELEVHRNFTSSMQTNIKVPQKIPPTISYNSRNLRILFQNRPQIDTFPGGDSVVMKHLQKGLISKGHKVDINANSNCDLSSYDIVHIFNFILPQITNAFARNALQQNIPFVITSMQENFPLYRNKAFSTFLTFKQYLKYNQDYNLYSRLIELVNKHDSNVSQNQHSDNITSYFAANNAEMIFACSDKEAEYIRQLHPSSKVSVVQLGSTITESTCRQNLFVDKFGVKDFVLCVARLEVRKNQLMLLKALEDDDIPLVFADGGFAFQQTYADLCRKFKRKGKTIFTGRLTNDFLISAYKAAAVHCLPSWFELPGLVTLEAAQYGCKVVASSWGSIVDYMGNSCYYCSPDDPESIHDAVFDAIKAPLSPQTRETAASFTWEKATNNVLNHYYSILGKHS